MSNTQLLFWCGGTEEKVPYPHKKISDTAVCPFFSVFVHTRVRVYVFGKEGGDLAYLSLKIRSLLLVPQGSYCIVEQMDMPATHF